MNWLSKDEYYDELNQCVSVDRIIGNVVGDIRNRASVMQMGLSLLQRANPSPEVQTAHLKLLQENLEHIFNIIDALQQYNEDSYKQNRGASDDAP